MYNFDWVQLSATCRKQTNASNHIVTSFIVGFMKGFKQVRRARSAVKILSKPRPDGTTVRNEVLDISTYSHDHYWKTSGRTISNVQQNCRSTSNRNHPCIKVCGLKFQDVSICIIDIPWRFGGFNPNFPQVGVNITNIWNHLPGSWPHPFVPRLTFENNWGLLLLGLPRCGGLS